MTTSHEIKCINKSDRDNAHERIMYIGGINNGKNWRLSQQVAIQGIEKGDWNFYVSRGGQRVRVLIATSRYGNKYLKTEIDNEMTNNLLSLPECPT